MKNVTGTMICCLIVLGSFFIISCESRDNFTPAVNLGCAKQLLTISEAAPDLSEPPTAVVVQQEKNKLVFDYTATQTCGLEFETSSTVNAENNEQIDVVLTDNRKEDEDTLCLCRTTLRITAEHNAEDLTKITKIKMNASKNYEVIIDLQK